MNIKEMVKDNKQVTFEFYRKGELWYKTTDGFMFPVPVEDTGDGTFLKQDKAMIFMRYIRKQIEAVRASEFLAEKENKIPNTKTLKQVFTEHGMSEYNEDVTETINGRPIDYHNCRGV
jgi:hypothetical protein